VSDVFYMIEFYDSNSGSVYSSPPFVTLMPLGDKHPKHHKGMSMKEEWLVKLKVFCQHLGEFHTH